MGKHRLKPYPLTIKTIFILTVVLNLLGCSQDFCDWYRLKIYHPLCDAITLVTDRVPFPLAEVLMYIGAILVFIAAVGLLCLGICLMRNVRQHGPIQIQRGQIQQGQIQQGQIRRGHVLAYLKAVLLITCLVLFIYTVNWVLPFRAGKLTFGAEADRTYSLEELETLRNSLVECLNEAAETVERDENGQVLYCTDLDTEVALAMNRLAELYPDDFSILEGYYPKAKYAMCSDFLEWMDIGGFTYPYTMEVTTNRYVDPLYYPALLAHEMSHHKGFYQENEATFLGYLACIESQDTRLNYSGYYSVYGYVNRAYLKSLKISIGEEAAAAYYKTQPQLASIVKADEDYAQQKADETYEQSVNKTLEKTVSSSAKAVSEVGWDAQELALGDAYYDNVVELLLKFYETAGFSITP